MDKRYINIPDKKIIENIEPFNGCFYYSCFNSALFPVLIHFGRSVIPILANGFTCYDLNKKDAEYSLFMQYGFIRDIKDIMDEQGMVVEAKEVSPDIVGDAVNSIAEDRPVIISVDCFNLSIRSDYYMKGHWRHSLLLYGYDLSEGIFNIIEQDNNDDVFFKKKVIPCNDIANAYNSFFDHFHKSGEFTYLSFAISSRNEVDGMAENPAGHLAQYRHRLKPFKNMIYNGIDKLKVFIEGFNDILLNESILQKYILRILNGFNDIIKSRSTDKYLISMLFGDTSEEAVLIGKIISNWNMVRTILAKYYYSGIYRQKSLVNTIGFLNEIVFLEEEYLKKSIFIDD